MIFAKARMLPKEEKSVGSIVNEFYESDIEFDMKFNRVLLKLIGVWPSAHLQTRLERTIARLAKIASILFLAFLFVPHGCHIFLVEKNSAARLKMIGAWSFCAMAILKYAIVIARTDGIKYCIERIAMDWRDVDGQKNRTIMLRNAEACRSFTKLCVAIMYGGSMVYTTALPFTSSSKSHFNFVIDNSTVTRPLAFPSQFFVFNPHVRPMYEIVFFGHTVSVAIMCTVASGVCTLAVKFVMHVYSQYQIVISLLERTAFNECHNEVSAKKQLRDIVLRYFHAVTLPRRVESVMNEVWLVEFVGGTFNICFIGYYLIKEWENSETLGIIAYIVLMMSFVSNIFILCYIGELLAEQSEKVGLAVYMIDWWRLPHQQARDIVMLIVTSNFPVKLTAGKMARLSLESFCSVIKAAVTYLNVLRNTMS